MKSIRSGTWQPVNVKELDNYPEKLRKQVKTQDKIEDNTRHRRRRRQKHEKAFKADYLKENQTHYNSAEDRVTCLWTKNVVRNGDSKFRCWHSRTQDEDRIWTLMETQRIHSDHSHRNQVLQRQSCLVDNWRLLLIRLCLRKTWRTILIMREHYDNDAGIDAKDHVDRRTGLLGRLQGYQARLRTLRRMEKTQAAKFRNTSCNASKILISV